MEVELFYDAEARREMREIARFHSEEVSEAAGERILTKMIDQIERLRIFPLMGPIHPDPALAAQGYRLLVLTKTYVAVYRVNDDTIYIYGVFNGRTDYPQLLR